MSSNRYPSNSRTQPARSKSPHGRPGSKKKSVKKFVSSKAIARDDDETMMSMLSAYTNSLNRFDGSPSRSKSPSGRMMEDSGERMLMLKSQLTEALEENAFIKSRLNAELKERHLMEAKYKELNKKFTESKKALQATGAALLQVHNQTSEMKNKRDEREVQLDESLNLNRNLNSKIAELESRLEQALLSNGNGSTTANLKRLIEDKENLIKAMEEQQMQLQSQMSKIRRDNYRLGEENAELQEAVDAKNRKIANLVKKATLLEEELEGLGDSRRLASRGRVMTPNGTALRAAEPKSSVDPRMLEKLNNFEGDKRFLEERMAQLEISLKQSESFIQAIQSGSQENSPTKHSGFFAGAGAYSNGAVSVAPPAQEKPSMASPRKSPGASTRLSVKAPSGPTTLAPMPMEAAQQKVSVEHAPVKSNMLPTMAPSVGANGVLTDALFSSSSVIQVSKVPNDVLDKPLSAPRQVEFLAPVAVVPGPPVDSSPSSTASNSRRSKSKKSKSSKDKSGRERTKSKDVVSESAPAGPLPTGAVIVPAVTVAAAAAPAAQPVVVTAPVPVVAPVAAPVAAPVVVVAPTPASAPAAPVKAPEPAPVAAAPEPAAAPVATPVAVPVAAPGEEMRTKSGSGNRASIRTPISREGKSASGRRPGSSKKPTADGEAPALEFPPSGTLANKDISCLSI